MEVLARAAAPPDAVVRYADHADGVIDLFLPPTFGGGTRSLDPQAATRPGTPDRGTRSLDPQAATRPGTPDRETRSLDTHAATRPGTPDRETRSPERAPPASDHPGAVDAAALTAPGEVGPCRLVVAIHGGFWREKWDRTHLRPFAAALVAHGFAVATPEYRRGPGGWPDASYDVARALDRVAYLVQEVAPGLVDPATPFTLTGHSAGGHLALWGGLRAGPARVRRIVALAPVADLVAAARSRMGDRAVSDFLGGDPDERPDAYKQADPMRLLPGDVPVTIIQGTLDADVPADANRAVAHALSTADSVTYVEVADIEHFGLIDPLSPAFAATVLPQLQG